MVFTETDIRNEIRKMVDEQSKNAVAQFFDVKPTFIHSILKGEKRISKRISERLGYTRLPVNIKVDRQYEKISQEKPKKV